MGSFSPLPLLSKEDNMVTTQNGDEVSLKPSETFGRFIAETESCTVTVWSVIIIIIIRVVISVFLFYLWVCCVALSYLFYDLCDEEEQNKKGDQSQLFFLDEWE